MKIRMFYCTLLFFHYVTALILNITVVKPLTTTTTVQQVTTMANVNLMSTNATTTTDLQTTVSKNTGTISEVNYLITF